MTDPLTEKPSRRHAAPSQRVHDAVLEAARDLIEESGFFGLTVDGLVARSGISKATIYRWWENRAAVALDMVALAYGEPRAIPDDGSAIARVREFCHADAEYLRGPAGQVIAGLVADGQREPDRARTFEQRYLLPRREQFQALIELAVADSSLPVGANADVLVDALEGSLYTRLLFHRGQLDEDSVDRLLDQLLGQFGAH
jgi:AcrR family transcriptional regulator